MDLWYWTYKIFVEWGRITVPLIVVIICIVIIGLIIAKKVSLIEKNFSLVLEYMKSTKVFSETLSKLLLSTDINKILTRLEEIERRVAPLPKRSYVVKEFNTLNELAKYFNAYAITISSSNGLLVESTLKKSDAEVDAAIVVDLYSVGIKALAERAPFVTLSSTTQGLIAGKVETLGLYFIVRTNPVNIYDIDYLNALFESMRSYLERRYKSLSE